MIDCGDLEDINAAMGLEYDAPPKLDPAIMRTYRCMALTGLLAAGGTRTAAWIADRACEVAEEMARRE